MGTGLTMARAHGGIPGSSQRREDRVGRTERAWSVIAIIIVGAVGLLLVAALMAPERSSDIWVNLAGSAAQVVVLALSGGVVATVVRDREARRDADQRRRESLLAYARQVDGAFKDIKAVRRLLRTYGFDQPQGRVLTAEQATGFRAQMAQLNDTQLAFEMHARVVGSLPALFDPDTSALHEELTGVAGYLRRVLLEWETDPQVVATDVDASPLLQWPGFMGFVGYDEASSRSFREGVAEPVARIEAMLTRRGAPLPAHGRPA